MSMGELGVVSVVDFLLMEYAKVRAKQENVTLDKAIAALEESAALMFFRKWAGEYLAENRPTTIQHAESNYIIQLMNGQKFAICPSVESLRGTMQPSGYVPVTGRETLAEMARNVHGMRDEMVMTKKQVDLSQGSPAFSFDQPGPFQRPEQ